MGKRNANMELLRILSMLMVTMLHALGKSGLLIPLEGSVPGNAWIAWIFEVLSIGAVNIFMLISGYYLIKSEFRWKRLAELIFQVLFYTLGAFVVFVIIGGLTEEEKDVYHILQYILPIHMDVYWFITSYVVIYALLPLIAAGVKGLTQKQLRNVILLLLVYESVIKSILPVALETDSKGYSPLWYLIVFLIGAYLRNYGFRILTCPWKGWVTYAAFSALGYAELVLLFQIHARTGRLGEIQQISTHYNHVFVLIASVGIFSAFVNAKEMGEGIGRVIRTISPYALGVYLFQENITLRYRWQDWFGLRGSLDQPVFIFLLKVFGAVLAMYFLGSIADLIRSLVFRIFQRK